MLEIFVAAEGGTPGAGAQELSEGDVRLVLEIDLSASEGGPVLNDVLEYGHELFLRGSQGFGHAGRIVFFLGFEYIL